MYWDGSNWVDETPKPTPSLAPRKRRARDWAATGLMGLVLVGLIIPTVGVFAGSGSGGSVATWSTNYKVTTYQENSGSVDWNGHWTRVSYRNYSGGRVRSTDQRGAGATVTFKGTGFAWVGPVGPTRGEAEVYVDGEYVKTVNMYASRYVASTVIFQQLFSGYKTHTFQMVSLASEGHETVAVDKFIIRGDNKVPVVADEPAPTPTATAAAPTAAPTSAPATSAPTSSPTSAPATAAPTPAPTPVPTAVPTPTPAPAGSDKVVTVASIAALKAALVDNSVDEIIVKNGTYHVSPSNRLAADSLWIGSSASGGPAFAERTRPVLVRAQTRGGVTFDGGGGTGYGGLSFEDGAHDQTWDGFNFANMTGSSSGIIEFGGYSPRRSPHHITLRNITIEASCHRASASSNQEQGIYFAHGTGSGPHDLLLEDIDIIGTDSLSVRSGFHAYHGDASAPAAHDVTVRRATVTGTYDPIILWWTGSTKNWLFEDITISGARNSAIRFEERAQTGIVFRNVVSTGSAQGGFYSSLGSTPAGITFVNSSLR